MRASDHIEITGGETSSAGVTYSIYTSYTVAAPNSNDSAIGMRKSGPTILPVRTVHGVCCDKFDIVQSFATPKELVTQLLNHFQVEFRLDFDRAVSL